MMIAHALPVIAGAASAAAAAASAYYATYVVRSQWLGTTDWRGRTDTGAVALTFDDGPTADTDRILDVLDRYNVRASFFMIGQNVGRHPETARRVAAAGHEIGNHSYSHPIYLYRSPRETMRQLERAQQIITETVGVRPRFARPPCGVRTPAYFAATRKLGLRTVQWDVACFDWKRLSGLEIARRALKDARAGSIILLHDGDSTGRNERSKTVAALPLIIDGLLKRGLRIAPLSELLLARKGIHYAKGNSPAMIEMIGEQEKAPLIFLDFDGTISRRDAIDAILETYADREWLAIEEEWQAGRIGSRECLRRQMELVSATPDELDALLASIKVDEGFAALLETCAMYGVAAHIVSDGFDYCIHRILSRPALGLAPLLRDVQIFSSHLERDGGNWRVAFPHPEQVCEHGCATCKPALMRALNPAGAPVIFVGDGLSDRYAARGADIVLAKNSLEVYCQDQLIPYVLYDNLSEVAARLDATLRARTSVGRNVTASAGA